MAVLNMNSAIVFLIVNFVYYVQSNTSIGDTELLMTYLIHRHGDRTPMESSMSFGDDVESMLQLIEPYGFEQLTRRGMQRGYDLGKFIRRRYNDFLSDTYNSSEIYIRSTDIARSKMTVLTAMAGVYPPGQFSWSDEIKWNPVPYTTLPTSEDHIATYYSCPSYAQDMYGVFATNPPEMEAFADVIEFLSEELQMDLKSYPLLIYNVYDYFNSQINLGLPLRKSLNAMLPAIEEAAGVAADLIFAGPSIKVRGSGSLLQDFYDLSAKIIAGEHVQRVRIYSAHDANVLAMSAVSKATPRPGIPHYGSAYALELRRVTATGNYAVLPVYLPTPEAEEIYLTVDGCSDVLCDLEQFIELTKENAVTETEWKILCEKL